jgi:hypothetical protein
MRTTHIIGTPVFRVKNLTKISIYHLQLQFTGRRVDRLLLGSVQGEQEGAEDQVRCAGRHWRVQGSILQNSISAENFSD